MTEDMLNELNDELDNMGCGFFFVLASYEIAQSMLKNSTWLDSYILHVDGDLRRYINNWFLKRGIEITWNNSNSSFFVYN